MSNFNDSKINLMDIDIILYFLKILDFNFKSNKLKIYLHTIKY